MNLWDFFKYLTAISPVTISKIQEYKKGEITPIADFYKNTTYKEVALSIRLIKDESIHRTIHKSKGDEFDNVLIIIKGKYSKKYNEERDLAFLLNTNLIENEDHRVYYVACSRAKENLMINVPEMSTSVRERLQNDFEIIEI